MKNTSLHTRLRSLQFLTDRDWTALQKLFEQSEHCDVGSSVVHEKQKLDHTRILTRGWAYRYKLLPDGSRQIINLLLPGDIIGFYAIMRNRSDVGVEALTPLEYSVFPAVRMVDILAETPRLTLALSWIASQSERMLDEQITRIGRRNASNRMAHLFVELFLRLRNAGFTQAESRVFPISQSIMADVLGMSHVHANRSFKTLAREGAVSIRDDGIHLDKVDYLAQRVDFDASYLEQISVPKKTRQKVEQKKSVL